MDAADVYLATARAYADLVDAVPDDAWERPALGVWDVRALVGHTSRALTTVLEYLARPAGSIACATAAEYFVTALARADDQLHRAVAERGVAAGADLGDDPPAALRRLVAEVERALDELRGDDPAVETIAGGIRLSAYLETRSFELTVHGLDLSVVVGVGFRVSAEALATTVSILGQIALRTDRAPAAIRLLTGRGGSAFSLL